MENQFVLGVDFGTDSVRTILVDTGNGRQLADSVFMYPRWSQGRYCNPARNQFRQHPLDYLEGLEATIKDCLEKAGPHVAACVRAISIDTTGSTPVAVNSSGIPLALLEGFQENPNAMFFLWKDHSAVEEAARINEVAQHFSEDYLKYVGGIYSSEWFWAKWLFALRTDTDVRNAAYTWVEHSDWMPFLLTGGSDARTIKRNCCAAGHKALWSEHFKGYPANAFFAQIDPLLDKQVETLPKESWSANHAAGNLCLDWAQRLGLSTNVLIGIGALDAHAAAVGGQIEPFYLCKVMGTSTCDILTVPPEYLQNRYVRGICGQVSGSVIPGMIGLEAGQSAFGDIFAWYRNLLAWPLQFLKDDKEKQAIEMQLISSLSAEADKRQDLDPSLPIAIDWLNGRRTPDANQLLKGGFMGLTLGNDAPQLFQSLVEAACLGAKAIVDRFVSEGVPIKGIIGMGGVARKSPYIMQTLADVLGMPIKIHQSDQSSAMGMAMLAATVAGIFPTLDLAMNTMGQGFEQEYLPNVARKGYYEDRMDRYLEFGAFIASPEKGS